MMPISRIERRTRRPTTESYGLSTSADRRSENVGIVPIIVPELKLGNVQLHVFDAEFVEAANDSEFEDAPEAFNRVGV
jgi:hypothetical protein